MEIPTNLKDWILSPSWATGLCHSTWMSPLRGDKDGCHSWCFWTAFHLYYFLLSRVHHGHHPSKENIKVVGVSTSAKTWYFPQFLLKRISVIEIEFSPLGCIRPVKGLSYLMHWETNCSSQAPLPTERKNQSMYICMEPCECVCVWVRKSNSLDENNFNKNKSQLSVVDIFIPQKLANATKQSFPRPVPHYWFTSIPPPEVESRVSCMLSTCSSTELYFSPICSFANPVFIWSLFILCANDAIHLYQSLTESKTHLKIRTRPTATTLYPCSKCLIIQDTESNMWLLICNKWGQIQWHWNWATILI